MATKEGRHSPPSRVAVYRFDKKRPLPSSGDPDTTQVDELMTEPGFPAFDFDGRPTRGRREIGGAAARKGSALIVNGMPVSRQQMGREEREPLAPADKPFERTGAGHPRRLAPGEEALEYHRRRLEARMQAGLTQNRRLVELALFGYRLFERSRTREARQVFEGIVASEPTESFAYTMLGSVFLAAGDDVRALALLDAAIVVDKNDLAARMSRGEIRLRRGQYRAALQDLERAVSGDANAQAPFAARARGLLSLAKTLRDSLH